MLFQTSIRRELGKNFATTLVILSVIVLTMALLRVLAQATRGTINPTDILTLLAYTMLGNSSILLALALFICIVHTLSRMAADNELVIWHTSGKGLMAMASPVFRFALPILLGITALTLVVWPWSNSQSQKLKDQYNQRSDIDRVAPGQFQASANSNRVFYIDNSGQTNPEKKNLFVHETSANSETIVTAKSGLMQITSGRQYLILDVGQQVVLNETPRRVNLIEFERMGHFVKTVTKGGATDQPPKAVSSLKLALVPIQANMGELAWRIGLVIAGFNFVILGICLSAPATNRQRKSMHYIYTILIFVTYYNFINVGQNWIGSGKVSIGAWLIALHGSVFVLASLSLAVRHNAWTAWPSFSKRIGR